MGEQFAARNSPARVFLMLTGSLAFVALGAWIAGLFGPPPRAGREWAGWLSMIFFGLCAVIALPRLFDRSDQIVIDRNGILWRRWSDATIPWTAIGGWRVAQVRNQRFICLFLKDPSQFPGSGLLASLGGLNKGIGFGDVALSATGTDRNFDDMLVAVERWAPDQRD